MAVRTAREQAIPEELVQRIGDLYARVAALNEYVRRATTVPENVYADNAESFARPIEFVTENGSAIVRRWEVDGSRPPANGSFCFLVRDPHGNECEINVEITNQLDGRDGPSNSRRNSDFQFLLDLLCRTTPG